MYIYRARHDNVPESPVCTLYGRKGNLLLVPLDVCILLCINGQEELRPDPEATRLIAAPILEAGGKRIGLIAQYVWPPPYAGPSVNAVNPADPVVTVQLAPSADARGIDDIRVLAAQVRVGDDVLCLVTPPQGKMDDESKDSSRIAGAVRSVAGWHSYPDLMHHIKAYEIDFQEHVPRRSHGTAVRLVSGELVGMLISTQNQADGTCRTLVYPT